MSYSSLRSIPRATLAAMKRGVLWRSSQMLGFTVICGGVLFTLAYAAFVVGFGKLHAAPIFGRGRQALNDAVLYAHAVTAIIPLAVGPFAFSVRLRARFLSLHRQLGKTYVFAIWVSSALGLVLALANTRGWIARAGFSSLALVWFATTLAAYRKVREGDVIAHRRWMIRSFAATLAVVSVRPMFLFPPSGISMKVWYPLVTWLCWVPNLLAAELYLRSTLHGGALKALRRLQGGAARTAVASGPPPR